MYDNSKTYYLVTAASKVLNLNAGEILQVFGKMIFSLAKNLVMIEFYASWDLMSENLYSNSAT